jgi:hypothetical protein
MKCCDYGNFHVNIYSMKISYFPNQAALNSKPVLGAFLQGCRSLGIETVENSMDADVAVIWSVLFQGRMLPNQRVYEHYRKQGKDVFVIDVGTLKRGVLWKISLNNINRLAWWGNEKNLNLSRPATLGLNLQQTGNLRRETILIAGQHERSLQWAGQPPLHTWFEQRIAEIRTYSSRPIIVRPHPRYQLQLTLPKDVQIDRPRIINNTYDDFNIDYNHHCVINFCSGPSIQSAIAGTPIICDEASLAYPVSIPMNQIENPIMPDRTDWFVKLCHTEWLVDEIAQGIPIRRLLDR